MQLLNNSFLQYYWNTPFFVYNYRVMKYIYGLLSSFVIPLASYASVSAIKIADRVSVQLSPQSNLVFNPINKNIVFRKQNEVLSILPVPNGLIYSFSKTTNKYVYTIIYKKNNKGNKAGVLIKNNFAQYSEICYDTSPAAKLKQQINEVSDHITPDLKVLDSSCDKLVSTKSSKYLTRILSSFLNKDSSYLFKCLNSAKAKENFEKYPNVQNELDYVVSSITKDINAINRNSLDLKIGCEAYKENLKIKYNAKFENNVITFPIDENAAIRISDCVTEESTIAHEYFHRAGVQDENKIKIIDSICAQAIIPEKTVGSCSENYLKLNCDDPKGKNCASSESAMKEEIEALTKEIAKDEQAKIQPKIVKNMEKVEIKNTQVTDKTWNDIAKDTTGKATAQSPEVRKIVQETNANFNKFSNVLNASLSTVEPAQADSSDSPTSSPSMNLAGSSSSSRSPASSGSSDRGTISREVSKFEITVADRKSNSKLPGTRGANTKSDEKYYTVEEYLVDQQRGFSGNTASNRGNSNPSASSRQALATTSSNNANNSEGLVATNSGVGTMPDVGQQGGGANLNIGGGSAPRNNSRASNRSRNQNNGRTTASVGGGLANNEVAILRDSPVIQGQEYSTIRSKYRKSSFTQELADQGINIYLKKDNISIGSKVNNSTLKFVDDGVSLRKVEK